MTVKELTAKLLAIQVDYPDAEVVVHYNGTISPEPLWYVGVVESETVEIDMDRLDVGFPFVDLA